MVLSKEITPVNIEDEMRSSYLDYAMSVIVGRALPDGRDGLKPAHRRILYAMFREGILSNKRYSKCAGVVGEVLKKYHPHGDSAVYDTLVRMAQEWNMRYPLIDGQGNFGSIDGDSPAAYRYTECRLTRLAEEMMANIDKNTVDFIPNFDDSTKEPIVLPTKIPNLLINGSDGIAVGMATKIPPHNLGEVIDALISLVDNPNQTSEELMAHIPGPDFPTGGYILGHSGIRQAYLTGRGIVQMRAQTEIEPFGKGDRERIIVNEIPFQVNKARLIESIATLVQQERIQGISEIRDESDRQGLRIVIELKKNVNSSIILNQLHKHTALQSSFGIIMLMIVHGRPQVFNLEKTLTLFLGHRKEVVVRRTNFELEEANKRAHILEGLKIAVENIDEVIALIKKSPNPPEAKKGLIEKYELTEIQAQAILEMRLQRLTGLERNKIIQEHNEILVLIQKLKKILASDKLIYEIITNELGEIKENYANERRTKIIETTADTFSIEDLIQEEEVVVTVSHLGYIKRNLISMYQAQNRGGRGKTGMLTRDEDFVEQIFVASTHSYVLVFTSMGRVHWLKVHEIPQAGRTARGRAISNLISLQSGEKVAAILPVRSFDDKSHLVFVTRKGTTKKTNLSAYSNPRQGGIIALTIGKGNELVAVHLSDGTRDILMGTRKGKTIRFEDKALRTMGRTATGVRGISLGKDDAVVGMCLASKEATILTIAENGYGKRTLTDEYRVQGRGGSGILTMKTTAKTGSVLATLQVSDTDDIMLITNLGKIIRLRVKQIPTIGRNTQGVRLINLQSDEKVVSVTKIQENDQNESKAVTETQEDNEDTPKAATDQ